MSIAKRSLSNHHLAGELNRGYEPEYGEWVEDEREEEQRPEYEWPDERELEDDDDGIR